MKQGSPVFEPQDVRCGIIEALDFIFFFSARDFICPCTSYFSSSFSYENGHSICFSRSSESKDERKKGERKKETRIEKSVHGFFDRVIFKILQKATHACVF